MENLKLQKNKKALSPVIATILLILLSVAAVSIISTVVINFVREEPKKAQKCFETIGKLTIDAENGYACYYNETNDEKIVNITIHKGDIEIKGIKISVVGQGQSEIFDITENLPGKGEERTYTIPTGLTEVERARIAPILENNEICKEADEIELVAC